MRKGRKGKHDGGMKEVGKERGQEGRKDASTEDKE